MGQTDSEVLADSEVLTDSEVLKDSRVLTDSEVLKDIVVKYWVFIYEPHYDHKDSRNDFDDQRHLQNLLLFC